MNVEEISEDKNGASYHGANLVFDVDMGDRYVTVIVMDDGWNVGDNCPEDTRALANKLRGSLADEWRTDAPPEPDRYLVTVMDRGIPMVECGNWGPDLRGMGWEHDDGRPMSVLGWQPLPAPMQHR